MKVTILIPTYNEEKTILEILNRVNNEIKKIEKFNFEIIVIDDFSNDKTLEFLEKNIGLYNRLIKNEKNYGKGYAIRKALENIETDIVLIQDEKDDVSCHFHRLQNYHQRLLCSFSLSKMYCLVV